MTFADSTVAESYTYAKDRYDADRTLTSIVSDSVYVSYKLDTWRLFLHLMAIDNANRANRRRLGMDYCRLRSSSIWHY